MVAVIFMIRVFFFNTPYMWKEIHIKKKKSLLYDRSILIVQGLCTIAFEVLSRY